MAVTTKTLYETDFAEWSARTAELIRTGRFSEIDAENVAEEIASLGITQHHAVESHLRRILLHQIKRRIQPQKETQSWRASILNSQDRLSTIQEDSHSLKPFAESRLQQIYVKALRAAALETGLSTGDLPETCPFTVEQIHRDFNLTW